MSYAYTNSPARPGWIARAQSVVAWMDERGPLSWIVVMVGSFIFGGPLGLLVLGFMLITGRFRSRARREGFAACGPRMHFHASRQTGNSAFDAYKAETLRRLEEEHEAFQSFLDRLREAKDKAEFDQFMADRARNGGATEVTEARDA